MGDIGRELRDLHKRVFKPVQHVVERVGKGFKLGWQTGDIESLVQC